MKIAESASGVMLLGLLLTLASCVGGATMAELEQEASRTGDWSAVERREAMEIARLEKSGPACPQHLIKLCVKNGPQITCSCMPPSGLGQP